MACLGLVCSESEYEARAITVVSAVPAPNAMPCNAAANKTAAINNAKAELVAAVKAQGEQVDTCKTDPACECDTLPDWPPVGGGWVKKNVGLQSVHVIPVGTGCNWTVTLKYDRYYRSRSADCLRKPLAMLILPHGRTVAEVATIVAEADCVTEVGPLAVVSSSGKYPKKSSKHRRS